MVQRKMGQDNKLGEMYRYEGSWNHSRNGYMVSMRDSEKRFMDIPRLQSIFIYVREQPFMLSLFLSR